MTDLINLPHASLSFRDAFKYRNQYISLSLAAELTGCSYHSLYAYATRHHLARTVTKKTTLHIRFGDLLVYLVKREEREQAGINDVYRRNSFAGARKRMKQKESEQGDDKIILR